MNNTTPLHEFHAHVYFSSPLEHLQAEQLHCLLEKSLETEIGLKPLTRDPIPPHTLPMFEINFSTPQLFKVLKLLILHRKKLSILIHPLTGDDQRDHTEHALWLGHPVKMEMAMFENTQII